MASRSYTPRELLRLRHVPVRRELYDHLQERLLRDQDLSEVLRVPLERSLPRILEEPTEMSEESDGVSSPHNNRGTRQLDGTDSEWRYLGRNASERVETQPISAPSDLVAQRNEGFQRFYRSVASPGHVRVTASGRIVPNTRGSSSPTARWIRDRPVGDVGSHNNSNSGGATHQPSREVHPQPGHVVFPHPFGVLPQPMMPGLAPSMVSTMPHAPGAYPMMPWQMGFNFGGAFGMQPQALAQIPNFRPVPPTSSRSDRQSDAGASENAAATRALPADQFDASRAFIYNGQWMMPPGHFYPYPVPPPHGFTAPPMLNPMATSHRNGPGAMASSSTQSASQPSHPEMANVNSQRPPNAPAMMSPTNQHFSSIRASAITRRQLDTLRNSLRWVEDQLQYNRHQIDERLMEHNAQTLRHSIQHFERLEELQLAFEERHLPRHQSNEDISDSTSQDGTRARSPVTSSANPEQSSDSFSSSPDESSMVRVDKGKSGCEPHNLSQAKASNSSQADIGITSGVASGSTSNSDANNKSSALPVTAALAPPFQPRAVDERLDRVVDESLAIIVERLSIYDDSGARNTKDIDEQPYLVGYLPPGISPELAEDTDYLYPRELTEDELRARHMYWGKAPHHLQSGLPKFDGRDFYPPSPAKGSSAEAAPQDPYLDDEDFEIPKRSDKGKGIATFSNADVNASKHIYESEHPFERHGQQDLTQPCSSRQNEGHLPRVASGSQQPLSPRNDSMQNSLNGEYLLESPNAVSGNSSLDENDESNLLFKGRNSVRIKRGKSTRSHNGLWQGMRGRGSSSGNVVPGTVSSTTAQGVLPHYGGHATASLTPAATNTTSSPRSSAARSGTAQEIGTQNQATERQVENRPPLRDTKVTNLRAVPGPSKIPPKV